MTPLIERDATLAALRECLRRAADRGHVTLVAGEAGIGKTSVLRAMADEHGARGPVWWGACDALETPHPLAPLLDIARENRTRFAPAIGGPRPALFEAVLDELRLAAAPVFVVIEDAHWADDATLDLLKFLGRRIDRTRAVLAISYRDDEVGLSHPLRRVLGELPPAHRTLVEVPRLSAEGG
jgi:predicted ATPase